jgi:hypothetical protein
MIGEPDHKYRACLGVVEFRGFGKFMEGRPCRGVALPVRVRAANTLNSLDLKRNIVCHEVNCGS